MTPAERTAADFAGTGLTLGLHPVGFHRAALDRLRVVSAARLAARRDGERVRIAGSVICRQRPGTAKGFLFLSLEDETGIANAIVTPDVFDANRAVLTGAPYLLLEGRLQNQQGAISVKADRAEPLALGAAAAPSHDFR
jgi:error-prone DNA polymerase